MDDTKLTRAQRLALAGVVAPVLRGTEEKVRQRRVARVDAEGKVVGYTTIGEVQQGILAKRQIEFDVVEGTRPKVVLCQLCGRTIKVGKRGYLPTRCKGGCKELVTCAEPGCAVVAGEWAMRPHVVAERKGPYRCQRHSGARDWARLSEEEWAARLEAGVMAAASARSQKAKERRESMTDEERAAKLERAKAMHARKVKRLAAKKKERREQNQARNVSPAPTTDPGTGRVPDDPPGEPHHETQ